MTAATRARTAGRPRRVKDSDSDGEVDQSDLSESTHRRQASSGPSNGRQHLDRTNSGSSGRNRRDTDSRNWAESERPSRSREKTESKVTMQNRFRCEFFVLLPLLLTPCVIIRLPKCFLQLDKPIAVSPPLLSLPICQQSSFMLCSAAPFRIHFLLAPPDPFPSSSFDRTDFSLLLRHTHPEFKSLATPSKT